MNKKNGEDAPFEARLSPVRPRPLNRFVRYSGCAALGSIFERITMWMRWVRCGVNHDAWMSTWVDRRRQRIVAVGSGGFAFDALGERWRRIRVQRSYDRSSPGGAAPSSRSGIDPGLLFETEYGRG